jgi:hypothetical protein
MLWYYSLGINDDNDDHKQDDIVVIEGESSALAITNK